MLTLFRYQLRIAFRIITRHKQHSLINILGLSIGLTFSLIAILFVIDELSFDSFHQKADQIYRINKMVASDHGSLEKNAESSGLLGKMLQENSPNVEAFARYSPIYQKSIITVDEKFSVLNPTELVYTDNSFLTIFDFKLLSGDPNSALVNPQSIVITEEVANALFDGDPLGNLVEFNDVQYMVTGIIESPPRNSHIEFKGLISWSTTEPGVGALGIGWMNNIRTQGICTYILLNDNQTSSVEASLASIVKTHISDRANQYSFYLQPLREIYLQSSDIGGLRMTNIGSLRFVYFVGFASLLLLIIAGINYVNITVSRSISRSKEVGIKKVNGASQPHLFMQFITETFTVTLLSLFIALGLVYFLLPEVNDLFGRNMSLSLLFSTEVIFSITALLLIVSLLGGIYPALIMSGQKPAFILKNINPAIGGVKLRDGLVALQLVICLVLISSSQLIYRQMDYVLTQDIGFTPNNLILVPLSSGLRSEVEPFLEEVKTLSGVSSASSSYTALGGGSGTNNINSVEDIPQEVEARFYYFDPGFAETYDLRLSQGRFFKENLTTDQDKILINESLLKLLNWTDYSGKQLQVRENHYEIIGVVQDFYFHSMHSVTDPAIIFLDPTDPEFAAIRFTSDPAAMISNLNTVWKKFEPFESMDYYFAETFIEDLYQDENRLLQSNVFFAFLTIAISLMGLFGVFSIILANKEKEFGIRKILGVNLSDLIKLYAKKYVFIILLSQMLAIPLVVWLIGNWLDNFRVKTEIDYSIFVISLVVVMCTSLIILISQIVNASRKNALKLLRDE